MFYSFVDRRNYAMIVSLTHVHQIEDVSHRVTRFSDHRHSGQTLACWASQLLDSVFHIVEYLSGPFSTHSSPMFRLYWTKGKQHCALQLQHDHAALVL